MFKVLNPEKTVAYCAIVLSEMALIQRRNNAIITSNYIHFNFDSHLQQDVKLKKAFDSSTEATFLMRELIEQRRGISKDEDEAIQEASDAYDTFQNLVYDLFKPESA